MMMSAAPLGSVSAADECSDKNWKACAGKPWVDGKDPADGSAGASKTGG